VELLLLLKFPREVFHLAPPVPITLDEGPQVAFEFGRIGFYFDSWDAPDPDLEDGPRPMADAFYTHLTLAARTLPEKLELALTVPAHPYASAVCSEPWEDDEPDDVARAEELCDRMFGDPALEDYLTRLGEDVLETIVDFLTILRVGYGQYLIPGSTLTRLPATGAHLLHDLKRIAHGLHGQASTHVEPDVKRLGDFGIRRAQVEDLLHAVLHSLPAVRDHGYGEGRELLVLLGDGAVSEDSAAHLPHGAGYAHGRVGDLLIDAGAPGLAP